MLGKVILSVFILHESFNFHNLLTNLLLLLFPLWKNVVLLLTTYIIVITNPMFSAFKVMRDIKNVCKFRNRLLITALYWITIKDKIHRNVHIHWIQNVGFDHDWSSQRYPTPSLRRRQDWREVYGYLLPWRPDTEWPLTSHLPHYTPLSSLFLFSTSSLLSPTLLLLLLLEMCWCALRWSSWLRLEVLVWCRSSSPRRSPGLHGNVLV